MGFRSALFKKRVKKVKNSIVDGFFDVILFPLRVAYKVYSKTDLYTRQKIKRYNKKLYKNIYQRIISEGRVYLLDFNLREEHEDWAFVSMCDNYALRSYTKESPEQLLERILAKLSRDRYLQIQKVETMDLFRYYGECGYKEYMYKVERMQ